MHSVGVWWLHAKVLHAYCCACISVLSAHANDSCPSLLLLQPLHDSTASLDAAVSAAAAVLRSAVKPVLLGGPRLRAHGRRGAFKTLAEAFKVGKFEGE